MSQSPVEHFHERGSAYICGTWYLRGAQADSMRDVTCKRCRRALVKLQNDILTAMRRWST